MKIFTFFSDLQMRIAIITLISFRKNIYRRFLYWFLNSHGKPLRHFLFFFDINFPLFYF